MIFDPKKIKLINYLLFVLSLAGLFVSSYLAYEYSLPGSITCPIGGSGCQTVRLSEYSQMFGISVPYYGILFYLVLSVASVAMITKSDLVFQRLRFLMILSGLLYSIYLTGLETFVIKAYCFWCVISAIIVTVMFFVSLPTIIKSETNE